MQVHYHPSGKPEVDRTRIGIYFAKKPVKQILHWNARRSTSPSEDPRRSAKDYLVEADAGWKVPEKFGWKVPDRRHRPGRHPRTCTRTGGT